MSDADDCLFCKIIAGEIPSDRVGEDGSHIAFRDINPKQPTHVLVVPRVHHHDLDAWVDAGADTNATMGFVRRVARDLGVDGAYRLEVNVGPEAGQEILHLHWHLLSRRNSA